MSFRRSSGVLLHPTSLPGEYPIGDLGPRAYEFVDFLARAKQTYWQILPLEPTGWGDSPYSSFSAFAGNTLFVSPEKLVEDGYLSEPPAGNLPPRPRNADTPPTQGGELDRVDYGAAFELKSSVLWAAFESWRDADHAEFDAFAGDSSCAVLSPDWHAHNIAPTSK